MPRNEPGLPLTAEPFPSVALPPQHPLVLAAIAMQLADYHAPAPTGLTTAPALLQTGAFLPLQPVVDNRLHEHTESVPTHRWQQDTPSQIRESSPASSAVAIHPPACSDTPSAC